MKHAALSSAFFASSAPVAAAAAHVGALSADTPVAGLAGTDLSRRFRYWRGSSGRRYLFSVFPLGQRRTVELCPRFEGAVILAVAHGRDDERRILCIEETGSRPDRFFESGRLREAVAAGANEIHVHLLTESPAAREALVEDLQA